MEPTQPPSCFESGCPLAGVAKGFVLGCGDPQRARFATVLEGPGREEISFEVKPNPNRAFLQTAAECDRELVIRKRDYPNLEEKWLKRGMCVVGQTGLALQFWIWPRIGLTRPEAFIDNTIRCLPPKSKSGAAYPTGETRKLAEACCRQYDRIAAFRPDTLVFSIHPASLLREITPLPLAIKDWEKVCDFTAQGRRVLALLGGKATAAFARYGSNVTRWRGHYAGLAGDWSEQYKELFSFRKKERKKKLTRSAEDDMFGVPESVTRKAREKNTRPEVLRLGTCKSYRRHRHKRPPKCGYAGCWDTYEIS